MLWSLIRVILFVAIIAGLAAATGRILDLDGRIAISMPGWIEFNLTPLMSALAATALVALLWILLKLIGLFVAILHFLNGDETAVGRFFDRRREARGFQALTDSLMALASGDGREAMIKAERAERFLRRPELTDLLIAQAAEMEGDAAKAAESYKRLLVDDRTRFVGLRGIMKQKLAEDDVEAALKLARKAFELKPRHEDTQDLLLRLQVGSGDWRGARRTLDAKHRHGSIPRGVYRRREAVLALGHSMKASREGNQVEARESAFEANRLSPDLIPAAARAARHHVEDGKPRLAERVLARAWESQPHPDLAAVFVEISREENPAERISRFRALTELRPHHPETRMLLAELHIGAGEFSAARDALDELSDSAPNARSLTLMAAIERGEGAEEAVVRGRLTQALTASRGPQWVCDKCRNIHSSWGPICAICGAIDSLGWTVPAVGEVAMPRSTGMLPLLLNGSGKPDEAEAGHEYRPAETPPQPDDPGPPKDSTKNWGDIPFSPGHADVTDGANLEKE